LSPKEKAKIVVANIEQLNKENKMSQDERQTLIRMVNYLEFKIEQDSKNETKV
tara:strand:+ start:338 stop:496 length:159 start_codon:yes stop_codon:yes gene_type:complete